MALYLFALAVLQIVIIEAIIKTNMYNVSQKGVALMEEKIVIRTTWYHRIVNILCVLMIFCTFAYLFWKWNSLPAKVPMHYDGAGNVDGYGGKWSVWLLPVFSLLMYGGITLLERYPGVWNTSVTITEQNKVRVYRTLKDMIMTSKLSVVGIFSFLGTYTTFGTALGIWFLPVSMAVVFVPIIFFMIRLARIPK